MLFKKNRTNKKAVLYLQILDNIFSQWHLMLQIHKQGKKHSTSTELRISGVKFVTVALFVCLVR